jgi:hypothetical protein
MGGGRLALVQGEAPGGQPLPEHEGETQQGKRGQDYIQINQSSLE